MKDWLDKEIQTWFIFDKFSSKILHILEHITIMAFKTVLTVITIFETENIKLDKNRFYRVEFDLSQRVCLR